jgi:tetratricopeptide (TPR) repeat protein
MRHTLAIHLALAVLTVAVYWQTGRFDFVNYDDPPYVTENPHVRAGLTAAGVRWAFSSVLAGNWHPLTTLSHMLACELFGVEPAGHHLMNVVLHVAATLVLFAMLQATTGDTWPSAFVAALFAVHPLHVESVAWVSSRKDPLSALFGFGAMWAYAAWARRNGHGGTARYLLALALFAASLMSKPMFVTLPVVLLLLDYWPLGRIGSGTGARPRPPGRPGAARASLEARVTEKLPFFALSVASSIVTIAAQRAEGAMAPGASVALPLRLGNALVSYARYLGKLVWPYDLAVLYPHPALPGGTPLAAWQITGAALVLAAVTSVMVAARRRGYPLVGWLWYAVMLLPVSGIVQVGEQAMADRYTYVPLVGLFMVIAWGAADLVGISQRRIVAAACLPGGDPALTAKEANPAAAAQRVHRAEKRRAERAVRRRGRPVPEQRRVQPGEVAGQQARAAAAPQRRGTVAGEQIEAPASAQHARPAVAAQRPWTALGDLLTAGIGQPRVQIAVNLLVATLALAVVLAFALGASRQARYWRDSTTLFERSLAVAPEPAVMHNNLAIAYQHDGNLEAAVRHYQAAVRVDPDYAPALTNLGALLRRQGQLEEAAALYRRALAADPRYAPAHTNLGGILADSGQAEAAMEHLRLALEADPSFAPARLQLGAALEASGNADEALVQYRAAIEAAPHWATAHVTLAEALRARREDDEAMRHYRRAVSLDPRSSRARGALAILLQGRGEVVEAIEHYRAALALDPDNVDLRSNLGYALYTRGDLVGAIGEFERALTIDPGNAKVHNNFAIALLAQGRTDEAIAHGRAALAARPSYAMAHNTLASALLTGGDVDAAIHHYHEALRIEPGYTQARENLARAEEMRKQGAAGGAVP